MHDASYVVAPVVGGVAWWVGVGVEVEALHGTPCTVHTYPHTDVLRTDVGGCGGGGGRCGASPESMAVASCKREPLESR